MQADPHTRAALFRDRNFRWLMAGGAISLLGDQFTLIALPWLVLGMTGDPAALGIVLALIGVPRALFILLGGAVVDRFSPRSVLMWTKHVNTVLLTVIAVGVWQGGLPLPALYALALGLGIASAFSIPSGTSILPRVLQPAQLPAANGVQMGLRQLSMFLGPLAAGLLIALGGDGRAAAHQATGLALAFAFDAFSFALSAWTLSHVTARERPGHTGTGENLWGSMVQGVRHVWRDETLRTCYLYWGAIAVLVMGPLHIALPVLANSHPDFGASAFGLMAGAHGAGMLLGMVVSGLRPGLRVGTLGTSILLADTVIGLLFMPMGYINAAWQGALLMLSIGVLAGSMQVAVFTWIQQRVPPALIGRAMSLFMFIFMGLVPLASSVTGWVLRHVTLSTLFSSCGAALVLLAAFAWTATPIRRLTDKPVDLPASKPTGAAGNPPARQNGGSLPAPP